MGFAWRGFCLSWWRQCWRRAAGEPVPAARRRRDGRQARRQLARARRSSPTRRTARRSTCSRGAPSTRSPPARGSTAGRVQASTTRAATASTTTTYWKTFGTTCLPYDGPPLAWRGHGVQGARRLVLGASGVAAQAAELRRAVVRRPPGGSCTCRTGPARSRCSDHDGPGRRAATTCSAPSRSTAPASTASARRSRASRSTASAATSTWIRSTRRTAPAGSVRTASSRTGPAEPSATCSRRHGARPIGDGKQYRATVIGPGVTPDVMWTGTRPAPASAADQAKTAAAIKALNDPGCQP